jgi:3-dehydroquinate synthase
VQSRSFNVRTINIPLGERSYPVLIGDGLLANAALWAQHLPKAPVFVVTNDVVAPLYLDTVLSALGDHQVACLTLPDGEAQKNHQNWQQIHEFLASHQAGRDSCVVALGGGVIGDLAGFAAATWMRGIRLVQAPTTLLAQVDASVGGKTAINIPQGKNLVGAFHQPGAVLADIATLATLPAREYAAGLAEVVKYGAIRDLGFIDYLEYNADALAQRSSACLAEVVARSVAHKAEVVVADEREQGQRALLNFGHSFGHALETHTAYQHYLHGEAVAIGMVMAARLSESRGLLTAGFAQRLADLLQALGLAVTIPGGIHASDLLGHMRLDKKNLSGRQRLVLLDGPGRACLDEHSSDRDILAAIESCQLAA